MVPSRGGTADDVPPRSSRGLPRVSDLDDLDDLDDADDADDAEDVRAHFWLYAVFFLLTMAQALPLTAVQVLLNRDLGLERRPELVNRFAVEFSMSTLKPLYAALSDLCPIRGLRRVPYMILGAVAHAAARQGFARVVDVGGLYVAGVLSVVFFSICETGADGALVQISLRRSETVHARPGARHDGPKRGESRGHGVERSAPRGGDGENVRRARRMLLARRRRRRVARARGRQPTRSKRGIGTRNVGGRVGGRERANRERTNRERATRERANRERANRERRRRLASRARAVSHAPRRTRGGVRLRVPHSPDGARHVHLVHVRAIPPPELVLRRAPVGVHGGRRRRRVGVRARASRTLTLAASFVAGAAVDAVCGLARLAVIDADDGVSAPVVALAASSLVTSFGIMFGYMPILALAARVAPPGLEAFGYALLLFVADLATSTGSMLAAELTRALGIGEGEGRSWSNLAAFVWMCAVMKLAPLALVSLAEENRGTDGDRYRRHEDEDEDEDDDDERALGERKANAGGGDAEDVDVEEESDAALLLTSRA